MYFGTPDTLRKGSTGLHKDVASACNILVYSGAARPGQDSGAEWLIFTRDDTKALSKYLQIHTPDAATGAKDPCHSGRIFLDGDMLEKLKDVGIRPFVFQQRHGQAVFIPAGCAHQVCLS